MEILSINSNTVLALPYFETSLSHKTYVNLKEELKKRAEMARERAKVKAQKEEQERASRAVAGVNHLDIPAELAFIFNKLDGKC